MKILEHIPYLDPKLVPVLESVTFREDVAKSLHEALEDEEIYEQVDKDYDNTYIRLEIQGSLIAVGLTLVPKDTEVPNNFIKLTDWTNLFAH